MKNPNYLIKIAEPCHEDWNKMLPDAKGKFCKSCSKSVVDFSNKTDLEIHSILTEKKGEKVCGHFRSSQVNRPLNIRIDLNHLPENMSTTKTFTLALLMVFGTMLFSFTDLKGQQIKNVHVEDTETVTFMKGKIARVKPVKEEKLPEPPDSLLITLPEPMIMGGIRYVEPEVQDSVIDVFPEPEILMGDTILMEGESCTANEEGTQNIEETSGEIGSNGPILESEIEFSIYPNPSHESLTVDYELLKRSDVFIQLLNDRGQLVKTLVDVKQQYHGRYQIPVDTKSLSNGVYILSGTVDEKRYSKRVIVER